MAGNQAAALISIYNSANDSEAWNTALDTCVDYVQAHSANILFQENDKNSRWRYSLGSQQWRSLTPEQMQKTIALFEKYDVKAWEFVHRHGKQRPLTDTDFWTDTTSLEQREDYQFFRNELGFTRKVGCKLNDNLCWTDNIAFQFPSHLQTVPSDSMHRIQYLLPHAAKSIELWRTFSILKSQYNAVLAALDHVKVGLCIAEPGGAIVVTNDEADRILSLGTAIRKGNDKLLHCKSAATEHAITAAIQRSCATSEGKGSISESYHLVEHSPRQQISVEVAPLRDSGAELAANFNGALITLIDVSADLEIDTSKIAAAYKLTSAEQQVCDMLIRGVSVADIAESRNVSSDTIKSQLKSIYRKTASHNRVALARLAIKADPPVR